MVKAGAVATSTTPATTAAASPATAARTTSATGPRHVGGDRALDEDVGDVSQRNGLRPCRVQSDREDMYPVVSRGEGVAWWQTAAARASGEEDLPLRWGPRRYW